MRRSKRLCSRRSLRSAIVEQSRDRPPASAPSAAAWLRRAGVERAWSRIGARQAWPRKSGNRDGARVSKRPDMREIGADQRLRMAEHGFLGLDIKLAHALIDVLLAHFLIAAMAHFGRHHGLRDDADDAGCDQQLVRPALSTVSSGVAGPACSMPPERQQHQGAGRHVNRPASFPADRSVIRRRAMLVVAGGEPEPSRRNPQIAFADVIEDRDQQDGERRDAGAIRAEPGRQPRRQFVSGNDDKAGQRRRHRRRAERRWHAAGQRPRQVDLSPLGSSNPAAVILAGC